MSSWGMEVYMCSRFGRFPVMKGHWNCTLSQEGTRGWKSFCQGKRAKWEQPLISSASHGCIWGKKITSSTPKALNNNVNFFEWFLGLWGGAVIITYNNQSFLKTLLEHVLLDISFIPESKWYPSCSYSSLPPKLLSSQALPSSPFFHSPSFSFCFPILPSKKWLSHEPC